MATHPPPLSKHTAQESWRIALAGMLTSIRRAILTNFNLDIKKSTQSAHLSWTGGPGFMGFQDFPSRERADLWSQRRWACCRTQGWSRKPRASRQRGRGRWSRRGSCRMRRRSGRTLAWWRACQRWRRRQPRRRGWTGQRRRCRTHWRWAGRTPRRTAAVQRRRRSADNRDDFQSFCVPDLVPTRRNRDKSGWGGVGVGGGGI